MTRTGKTFVALGLLSPLTLVAFLPPLCVYPQWASNERNASATLKTLASAQADFRSNDRDGDGLKQAWRGDVAGLYLARPTGSGEAIRLIERSAAMADLRLATAPPADWEVAPKAGYWYAALRFEDEAPGALAPDRFAFVAVPDTLLAGKTVFAITQAGAVWRRPARGGVGDLPTAFPLDPAAAGWTTGW